jgi:hypothetical protein
MIWLKAEVTQTTKGEERKNSCAFVAKAQTI